ncbi:MAG TPA: ATP-binding protein [Anaerolineales bacterium]|nr:ATP-binding protein [Anaerolineales bacterium]
MAVIEQFKNNLYAAFAARVPCVFVDTGAPERAYPEIWKAYERFAAFFADSFHKQIRAPQIILWHPRSGLPDGEGDFIPGTQSLSAALDAIRNQLQEDGTESLFRVFVLPHIAQALAADPDAVMAFEELLMLINGDHTGQVYAGPARLAITGMVGFEHMPAMLTSMLSRLEFPYPDEDDIIQLLQATIGFRTREHVPPDLVSALLGLDYRQAQIIARVSATAANPNAPDRGLAAITAKANEAKVEEQKTRLPFVKFHSPPKEEPAFVGMTRFMQKIERVGVLVKRLDRKSSAGGAFTLIGPPGTGKSSSVKMLSWITGFPIIEFSFGDLMQSLVGQSEERLRDLFKVVRAMNRVIVFADEMDKQSPDMRGTAADGGLAARLQSAYLGEMQKSFDEGRDTLWVATANRVGTILPEFFDRTQVWTVDYPPQPVIERVFAAHLSRLQGFAAKDFDFPALTAEMYAQFKGRQQRAVSPRLVTHALREACQVADVERDAFCPTQEELLAVIADMASGKKLGNGLVGRSVWDTDPPDAHGNDNGARPQNILQASLFVGGD